MSLRFDWNKPKAKENYAKHGVSFDLAKQVFRDPFAVEFLDDRQDYGESRFVIIATADGHILYVAYTERNDVIRRSQPGGRQNLSRKPISKETRKELRPMTRSAIERAALADPDARPLSSTELKRMKRTPQAKIIRRALGMTQQEFAARYHIPLGTLRDWEQGRSTPDQPARAYLTVIAHNPDSVQQALQGA